MAKGIPRSSETPNSSTSIVIHTKNAGELIEYRDIKTGTTKLVKAELLRERYITWADKKDSYRISDFLDEEGIESKEFERLKKKYPFLKEANEYAVRRLASRREIGAMTGKFKEATIFRSLSRYCPIDKEEWQERVSFTARCAAEAKKITEDKEEKIIVIERMPSTDTVPKRSEEPGAEKK